MTTTAASETDRQQQATVREAALRAVALDCLRRLTAGEELLDESIERAHPDLMPELAPELAELRRIHAAAQMAEREPLGVPLAEPVPHAALLRIRCPECHTPAEIVADSDLKNVTCASCGGQYSLVGREDEGAGASLLTNIGHFELLEQIGVGGFGTVWKAQDKELDRLVAIKLPRRGQLGPDETEQFFREARAAAQLRHPNIVSVHEVGRDGDRVYLVSDLVEGSSLAEWLVGQRMSAPEAAALCQTIALALEHAHAAGVVHRDLKPANVLLDRSGEPHITDFGLARRQTQETTLTLDGQFLGTPAYMSPEQARGESHQADQRSDIYSLGVILYELLTGEIPFRGNPANLLHQIVHEEPRSPRALNRNIPRDLETIALKCLEKDPARRYATARALADDLGRFLRREPIHARPVSKPERLWRWCRRRPVVAGLTAAVALLLVTVAGVTTWSSIRSQAAAKEARWQQYLSDMHVAMQAWDEGDVGRAIEALERHRPALGEEDMRRFEWYYLWRQCQAGINATVLPQDGRVWSLAVSPDGQWLAVCADSTAYTVDVWHLPTKEKRYTLQHRSGSWVKSVAFSPDSQSLISGDTGGRVWLWDLATRSVRHELSGHTNSIHGIAFSPDGTLAASASRDHTVRLWDTATGTPVHTFVSDNEQTEFYPVAFSPDGKLLATGGDDQTAKLWDITARLLIRSFSGHADTVRSVAFSPDGNTLATGSADRTVKLWSVADGKLRKTFVGHTDLVKSVAFASDGKRIASGSSDGTVRVWDVTRGSPAASRATVLRGHSGRVQMVTFAPDGQTLVSGGSDGMVRLWPIDDAGDSDVLRGHSGQVWALDVSGDGRTIASADSLGAVKFWDLERATLLQSRTTSSRQGSNTVAFSPSGRYLAVGDDSGNVELWETASSTLVRLTGIKSVIQSLSWSPDETTLAAGDTGGGVTLWDVAAATPRLNLPGHKQLICSVAFSPDGTTFATRCEDGTLRIWDPRTGELRATIDEPAYYFCPTAFSPDGRILASGSADLSVKFWDTSNWTLLRSLRGHADRVKGLAFSPDGRTIASACDDGQIKLWEVATGEERCTLRGHTGEVEAVRFTPDGQTLVSSSADSTVRLWRTTSPDAADSP